MTIRVYVNDCRTKNNIHGIFHASNEHFPKFSNFSYWLLRCLKVLKVTNIFVVVVVFMKISWKVFNPKKVLSWFFGYFSPRKNELREPFPHIGLCAHPDHDSRFNLKAFSPETVPGSAYQIAWHHRNGIFFLYYCIRSRLLNSSRAWGNCSLSHTRSASVPSWKALFGTALFQQLLLILQEACNLIQYCNWITLNNVPSCLSYSFQFLLSVRCSGVTTKGPDTAEPLWFYIQETNFGKRTFAYRS